jgi:hypothetical protein
MPRLKHPPCHVLGYSSGASALDGVQPPLNSRSCQSRDTPVSAAELGVQDPDALLGALHEHTVAALLGIVTERRQREARLLARGPRPKHMHKPNMREENRPP